MKKVIIVGTIDNSGEVKLSQNNLEILEYTIDDIKVKSFGKVVEEVKKKNGLVIADGTIQVREYTNKDGKTFNIQEVIINKVESVQTKKEVDNFEVDNFEKDVTPKDFDSGVSKIPSAKEIEIDPEELPFY